MKNERHDLPPAAGVEAGSSLQALIAELAHRAKHQVWGNMTVRCQEAFPNDPPSWCVGCLMQEAAALLSASGASGEEK